MNIAFSWFCKIFIKPIVNFLFIKEIRGIENIPKRNFILASNHQSYLDILIDGYLCVPRKFHFIGHIEGFKTSIKWFITAVYFLSGVIPLDRKNDQSKKMVVEKAIEILKKRDILIIYPEGRRSINGEIQKGKFGIAKIFLKTGVPILPVGIKGAFELLPPKGKLNIKKIIKINIGQPLFFERELAETKNLNEKTKEYKEILQEITKKVMIEINNLCQTI